MADKSSPLPRALRHFDWPDKPQKYAAVVTIDPFWLSQHLDYPLGPLGSKLACKYVDLESGITETVGVNYADSDVVGRAEAYKTYMGSANREIQLTFHFVVDKDDPLTVPLFGSGNTEADVTGLTLDDLVVQPALWFDSLKQPWVGSDGLSHAPPPCYLQIGELFVGRCVVTDASITWHHPFSVYTLFPHHSEVQVTFAVVRETIENYSFGKAR